jgi:hypothetical protein
LLLLLLRSAFALPETEQLFFFLVYERTSSRFFLL